MALGEAVAIAVVSSTANREHSPGFVIHSPLFRSSSPKNFLPILIPALPQLPFIFVNSSNTFKTITLH